LRGRFLTNGRPSPINPYHRAVFDDELKIGPVLVAWPHQRAFTLQIIPLKVRRTHLNFELNFMLLLRSRINQDGNKLRGATPALNS
jgi:hypothetical protein